MKPRKVLRIATWEVTKNAGGIDRRTLAVAALAIGLLVLVGPLVAAGGVSLEDDLYRVSVDENSPYYDVVAEDDTFRIVPGDGRAGLHDGTIDLYIEGMSVQHASTVKGEAAHEALRAAVQRYNQEQLRGEANQTAAFPVQVTLEFHPQPETPDFEEDAETVLDQHEPADDPDEEPDQPETDGTDDTDDDEQPDDDPGETDGTDDTTDQPTADTDETDDESGPMGGLAGQLGDGGVSGTPSDLSPPFPFQSLILAFLFVIPLNFLIQAYGSTILSERINRRGELLLVSPVSRYDIIAGKTLPYFVGGLLLEAILAVGLIYLVRGELGGVVSILALAPLVLLFLGATFLGAMFARSFKELTFITVTITVGLTTYAFVPAIFTDTLPIALISPLTIVVMDLGNESISLSAFVFSVTPPTLVALVFFGLGAGLYREEDMFDQRSMSGRLLDALVGPIRKRWHVGMVTVVLIPFVFVAQLLTIALLFMLGEVMLAIVLLFVVVAVTEELAKSLHIYAAYEHNRFTRSLQSALILGAISGIAFFSAEKIALLVQLVAFADIELGEVFVVLAGADPSDAVLFMAPLSLHVFTAAISAFGASKGKDYYVVALAVAMLIHFAYNLGVVFYVA